MFVFSYVVKCNIVESGLVAWKWPFWDQRVQNVFLFKENILLLHVFFCLCVYYKIYSYRSDM